MGIRNVTGHNPVRLCPVTDEEGTPSQIFDHPQKQKTIEFIRKQYKIEVEINEKGYDFPGVVTQMNEFILLTKANAFPWRHVALVAEELALKIILPSLKKPDIFLTIEYINKQVFVQVEYNGEKMDLVEELSKKRHDIYLDSVEEIEPRDLSLNIIRAYYEEAEYEYREADRRPNRVKLKIK